MSKHTPEPWAFDRDDFEILASDGKEVANTWTSYGNQEQRQANAQRIVACVNACKDIPSEHLENAAENTRKIISNAKLIEQQRDELLAILEEILQQPDRISRAATAHSIAKEYHVIEPVREDSEWYGRILAAIAKAKGGENA